MKDFTLDSITVSPMQVTYVPGVDYMTSYVDWLYIQVGGLAAGCGLLAGHTLLCRASSSSRGIALIVAVIMQYFVVIMVVSAALQLLPFDHPWAFT